MLITKKINFSKKELKTICQELDGYIWIAIDVVRGIIASGDEHVASLKQALFNEKCFIFNIFGVGMDLTTGEIDFISPINIKYMDKNSTKFVPHEHRDRIETLIRYFFAELPALKRASSYRYSKRPALPFAI